VQIHTPCVAPRATGRWRSRARRLGRFVRVSARSKTTRNRVRSVSGSALALVVMSAALVACFPPPPPPPPDRPWPPNQSFPGPACLDNPGTTNRVACENTAAGNPSSEWDVAGSGDPTIQGFATSISVNRSEEHTSELQSPYDLV